MDTLDRQKSAAITPNPKRITTTALPIPSCASVENDVSHAATFSPERIKGPHFKPRLRYQAVLLPASKGPFLSFGSGSLSTTLPRVPTSQRDAGQKDINDRSETIVLLR